MEAKLIAIVGGSGSGKTWLAEYLVARLDGAAGRISLDDFYCDLSHLSGEERAEVNFDRPGAIDWGLFGRTLSRIQRGIPATLPKYNFATHTRSPEPRTWQPFPLVILDGLWLLRRASLRRMLSWSVFLECSEETRLARRLHRDQTQRQRSPDSIYRQFTEQVKPMHRLYVDGQASFADLVIPVDSMEGRLPELLDRCRDILKASKICP